jgi:hypothetical protein
VTLRQRGTIRTTDDVTRRHVEAWAAPLIEGRRSLVLEGGADDPDLRAQLADAERWEAVCWLDAPRTGLPLHLLATAAGAGVRLVLAVRGLDPAAGEGLAERIGGHVVGRQAIVQASLIGDPADAADGGGPVVSLADGGAAAHRTLIVANAGSEETEGALDAVAGLLAETVDATHVERLETAYRAMRRANARLVRENLGRHDAAAASVIGRLTTELAEATHRLETEIEVARRNDEYFQAARSKLGEPHHRAAEKLYQMIGRIPAGQALSRRLLSRGRGS